MRQFNRYLWTGLVAVFAAACGDDVTVTNPPEVVPPTPGVTAVSVAPDGATLAVGAKLGMTAAATLQPGAAAPTWAWATSSAAVATVAGTTASAEVTAVAAGSAGIRATATSGTSSASGVATVVVTAAPACVINGVSISPSQATLAVGQTVSAAATVSSTNCAAADIGVAYTSSNATVATVSAAGVVTALATGSATITATSSKDATKKAAFSLTVVEPSRATISIQAVCYSSIGGCVPVDLFEIDGATFVAVNLERNGQPVTGVDLLVDGAVVYSQTFAATAAGVDDVSGEANAVETINMPWNTAYFNPTTGVVRHANGPHTVQARVNVAGSAGNASPSLQVVTDNNDVILVTTAVLNGSSIASPNDGLLWSTGDLRATALPVIYTAGGVVESVTLDGTGANCDLAYSPTITTAPYQYTWTKALAKTASATTGRGSLGVEDATCEVEATSLVSGEAGPNSVSAERRLDNQGPSAPTFELNPNGRSNSWINGSVDLVGEYDATLNPNGWLVYGSDAGVGGYTPQLSFGLTSPTTIATARAATPSSAPSLPAPSATGTSYCAMATALDALGNRSDLLASTTSCATATGSSHLRFGVDIAAPVLTFKSTSPLAANDSISGADIGANFLLNIVDTGAVGNSGAFDELQGTLVKRAPSSSGDGAGTNTCRTAAGITTGAGTYPACTVVNLSGTPGAGGDTPTTLTTTGFTGPAYYTMNIFGKDAAGNQTATLARTVAVDNVNPSLTVSLFNTPLTGGSSATFNALASDNFSLWYANYDATYCASTGCSGGGSRKFSYELVQPFVQVSSYNAATIIRSNASIALTMPYFIKALERVRVVGSGVTQFLTGKCDNNASGGDVCHIEQIDGRVKDHANNTSSTATTDITPSTQVVSYSNTEYWINLTGTSFVLNFDISAPAASATLCRVGSTGCAATTPTSRTVSAVVSGPTGTFQPPFDRVQFYALRSGKLYLVGEATAISNTTDTGATYGRSHTYSITLSGLGLEYPTGALTIHAIGLKSGVGLVSLPNTNITLQ